MNAPSLFRSVPGGCGQSVACEFENKREQSNSMISHQHRDEERVWKERESLSQYTATYPPAYPLTKPSPCSELKKHKRKKSAETGVCVEQTETCVEFRLAE